VLVLAGALAGPVIVAIATRRHERETAERLPEVAEYVGWPLAASAAAIMIALAIYIGRRRFARPTRIAGATAALLGRRINALCC
jgi:hypothetical protein